jgi:hypothetical protein
VIFYFNGRILFLSSLTMRFCIIPVTAYQQKCFFDCMDAGGRAIQEQRSGVPRPLGEQFAFIPGHGPMSTFGAEMRSNPYVSSI